MSLSKTTTFTAMASILPRDLVLAEQCVRPALAHCIVGAVADHGRGE
jgi:hypothetical protein